MPSDKLCNFFRDSGRVAVCFSGGVDSSFLIHRAIQCKADFVPVFVKTPFISGSEEEAAREFCGRRGIAMVTEEVDLFSNEDVVRNGPDRCYHCKRAMLSSICAVAEHEGCDTVADGTNASDPLDERPGSKALAELGVRSPLRECGITKSCIRRMSRGDRLETWNMPSNSCFATRIATGVRITPELISKVAEAEDILDGMGFSGFRVRTDGKYAVLQLPKAQIPPAKEMLDEISSAFEGLFSPVSVDDVPREE